MRPSAKPSAVERLIMQPGGDDDSALASEAPAHERVYRTLRQRILIGGFLPGKPVTLRGIAQQLDVSPMPVREAVRRLIAERALELHDNRRVSVPAMTASKFDQILMVRRTLEPELAARALPHCSAESVASLQRIDDSIDHCMQVGDTEGYLRLNHLFHFTLYRLAEAHVLLALVESVWLQFGPFMRVVYGRFGTANLVDQHVLAIDAVRRQDEAALRLAISEDIMQGMRFIGEEALKL
jgi:DNA-binding GntR family transcriptional regulator